MDRGQTIQDYLIGIGLLLLTLTGVFLLVPSVFTPIAEPLDRSEHAKASAVADHLVDTYETGAGNNVLNFSALVDAMSSGTATRLRDRTALDGATSVNVTLVYWQEPPGVGPTGTHGRNYEQVRRSYSGLSTYNETSDVAATAVRVVTFDRSKHCQPSCRLIVRVW